MRKVGSHYHFIETNPNLRFDRVRAYGKRLDIAAGTAVRFEPGDTKTVTLCTIAGARKITGGNGLATGVYDPSQIETIVQNLVSGGFAHTPEPNAPEVHEDTDIVRATYVAMFGPTVGDRVRLGDTDLWVEVEHDAAAVRLLFLDRRHALMATWHRRCTVMKSNSGEVSAIRVP